MLSTDTLKKLNEKYVGKLIDMYSDGWYAKIEEINELGWTFVITNLYSAYGRQKAGDIIFYSHSSELKFTIIE